MESKRNSWDDFYMNVASVASKRANCSRRKVGSVIVVRRVPDKVSIVSTGIASMGFNGTPFGVKNCNEGGCPRCASSTPPQEGYDWCLCVHAEQNAIALAARHGISVLGATLYSTLQPCFGCLKDAIQSGIGCIIYEKVSDLDEERRVYYRQLQTQSGIIMKQHQLDEFI